MDIITGHGASKSVITIPTGAIFKAAPKEEQAKAVGLVCNLLGIKHKDKVSG